MNSLFCGIRGSKALDHHLSLHPPSEPTIIVFFHPFLLIHPSEKETREGERKGEKSGRESTPIPPPPDVANLRPGIVGFNKATRGAVHFGSHHMGAL